MRILITGGTGFIGRELSARLISQGHQLTFLVRNRQKLTMLFGDQVSSFTDIDQWTPDISFDAVINLAGEPIADRRWSDSRKKQLWESRVSLTQALVRCMVAAKQKPGVFISGSAIGIYGDQGDAELDENSHGSDSYSHRLCLAWEQSALQAEPLGVRVCLLRTGLVVGRHGGFLQRMLLPFRFCLGGRIGSGQQWMSWIHMADHLAITEMLLASPVAKGAFNLTSPNPVTNDTFTQTLARVLNRPALLPVPAWLIRVLAGEMAELFLGSQRVLPVRVMERGFHFGHESLEAAIRDAITD